MRWRPGDLRHPDDRDQRPGGLWAGQSTGSPDILPPSPETPPSSNPGNSEPLTGTEPVIESGQRNNTVQSDCNPSLAATENILLVFAPFPSWYKAGLATEATVKDAQGGSTGSAILDAARAIVGAVKTVSNNAAVLGKATIIGKYLTLLKSAQILYQQCLAAHGGSSSTSSGGVTAQGGGSGFGPGETGALNELLAYTNDFQNLIDETTYLFGSSDGLNVNSGPNLQAWLTAFTADTDADGDSQPISSDQANPLETMTLPEGVSLSDVQDFIARWNQTLTYNHQGILDSTQVPAGGTTNFIARDILLNDLQTTDTGFNQIQETGNTDFAQALLYAVNQLYSDALVASPPGTVWAESL